MNILYGIPGEGMGHATRSKVVIEHLLKAGHSVMAVSSGKAFRFLDSAFPGKVIEIKGLHFAFKNSEISKAATFLSNLKAAPKNLIYNTSKKLLVERSFKTDVVISDFESFSYYFAKSHRLPVISIDNMQVMDRCTLEIDIAAKEKKNYRLAKNIVKAKVPGCDHYFISSFFEAAARKKNTSLVPPIIRPVIETLRPTKGNHILVYLTSANLKTVAHVLHQLPAQTFFVYGLNQDFTDGNIVFKPFSETGFISDLAGAKAVIANGGFSFISEAVYLKKPVCSLPIPGQFEQWMNAAYIEKLRYGRHFDELNADCLKAFLFDLPEFENRLSSYSQDGNKALFEALDQMLGSLVPY